MTLPHFFPTPLLFACWSQNDVVRRESSSGGIFTEVAKVIIDDGGVVFGASFEDDFRVRHIPVDNEDDLTLLQQSKYVQSHVDAAYTAAMSTALHGRPVLFSGTPCQIAAFNTFVHQRKHDAEIYTCEVLCHGVPSETVYQSYLAYITRLYGSTIQRVFFRDKTINWQNYGVGITFSNGEKYFQDHTKDLFMNGYLNNLYLRSACYDCPYAVLPRIADLTLGDFWGAPKVLDDDRGVSVVAVNSQRGKRLFGIGTGIEKVKITLEQIKPLNPRLVMGQTEQSSDRERFFLQFKQKGFVTAMKDTRRLTKKLQDYLKRAMKRDH
jgi:coenzyme F420-reducing hydrogenase beta subunit